MADLPTTPHLPGLDVPEAAGSFLERSGPGMGEYSGDLLRAREPRLYQAAIELLARGYGVRDCAQILSISARSVMAIRDREPDAIATRKEIVARRFLDVAQLSAEIARDRLLDDPESVSFKDLMIGGAVATDKHLVLTGEATQRIEHVVRPADDSDFARMLEDARRRGQVIDAEVIEDARARDTDLTSGQAAPNGAAAGPAGGPDPAALDAGRGSRDTDTIDMQSTDIAINSCQITPLCGDATGCATGEARLGPAAQAAGDGAAGVAAARRTEGGRGSAADRGPDHLIYPPAQNFNERGPDDE